MKTRRGFFITFEGGEGSGKSYQTRALYRRLQKLLVPVVLAHEPGSTALGERLSRMLKWGKTRQISPLAEVMLFNAARAQLVKEVILPALDDGKIVICDRFADSTAVYQGYGRGLDINAVKAANLAATGALMPDLTFLLDIPVKDGLARKSARETNRFEREAIAFHQRVRQGYLELAAAAPSRFVVIDARQARARIAAIIWQVISSRLGKA